MRRKIVFFFIVGLIIQIKLNAQASMGELENNKVLYPSPTAASLGKYGEYPVSLYNGLVNIGQDIVTVKSGRLSLNVSLSYHASGNKPSDIPGWVGLGFSLNVGGVITRITRDQPDDLTGGFYVANENVKYLWNHYPNSQFVEEYYAGTTDPRSDLYQFNFCGYTGEFVFDWNQKIHFKQLVPFDIKILGGTGGFGGFEITTADGTVYRFDQAEHSQVGTNVLNPPISSWYLTKISNLSGDIISLKYTDPGKFRYKQYTTRKEVAGTFTEVQMQTGATVNVNTSRDEAIYLDEIDFNNGKLIFGKSIRTDPKFVPNGLDPANVDEKKLDLITLKDNSDNVIKKWKFEYFENSTERLKLKDLIVQGSDQTDVQKYSFDYNYLKLPLPFPGPNPSNPYSCNDVDFWGYYNASANGGNKIPKMYLSQLDEWVGYADRSIRPTYVKAEILEKITYPTGGYTSFEYESNDYSQQGESYAVDQNPLMEPVSLAETYELNYDREEGGFDVDPASLTFALTEETHVYIRYSCGADGPNHGWAEPGVTYEHDLQMPVGTHTFQGIFNINELSAPTSSDITRAHCLAIVYKVGEPVRNLAKTGPGLRIKSISTSDGITTTTRSFEYKTALEPEPQNSDESSGYLSVFPAFYALLQDFASNVQGYSIASEPINDIGEGAPVGYSRVVERFQDNSCIVHKYRSYGSYPDEIMPFLNMYSNPHLAHMSSNDFQRGQETSTSYYNADGILQKEIIKDYDILPGSTTNVQCIELKPTIGFEDAVGSINMINGTLASIYYVHSCFFYNTSQTEKIYDKNGENPITTVVSKAYDNGKHLLPTRIRTIGSDGSVITTATNFPDDFAPGVPFIDYMQTNHLMSYPVEQVTYKERDGVTNIVSGNIITYKTEGAGLPQQLLKLETARPISQASFQFSNRSMGIIPPLSTPSSYNADAHYKPALTYTQYDNKGNLLESISRNGIKTAYLWGYKQEYPVAQIVGSDYATASGKISSPSMLDNPVSDESLRTELNNLRTIPGAYVNTITYTPLIGVTSETDPNGRTNYYEYDPFARLSAIRDQDHNVLKKYCYNYTGQPDQCNFYKNAAISDDYYSQNCPSGQIPVAYHISVAAGMFTAVDQLTANQLAQQYAQDQANQHGTCQLVYQSDAINANYYSQNCPSGQAPLAYPVSVPYGMFTSTVDPQTANQLAQQYAQSQADQHGTCQVLYQSAAINDSYYSQNCPSGQGPVAYPVSLPQGMFTSTVDQQTANQLAQQYAQSQANQHGSCQIVYQSAAINDNYFSQNCPSGQGPVAYPVSLPQGMFTSTVDQQTANQLAQQYAQSQANQHGTCEVLPVSLYYDNQIGGPLTIQVQNTSTGQNYYFTAYGHDSGVLGDVPPGTYNITVNGTSYFYAEVCGYYLEGPTPLIFYGMSVGSSCNLISIY